MHKDPRYHTCNWLSRGSRPKLEKSDDQTQALPHLVGGRIITSSYDPYTHGARHSTSPSANGRRGPYIGQEAQLP